MATNQMRREAAKRKLASQQERRAQAARRRTQVAVITSAAVVVVVLAGVVLATTFAGRSDENATDPAAADASAPPSAAATPVTPEQIPTEIASPPERPSALPASVTCGYPVDGSPAATPAETPPTADVSAQGSVAVTLQTGSGTVPLTLDRALAPCTVNSFVSLAEQGYFNQTPCHRLTTAPSLQVLQCGDPSGTGSGGPGYSFADETFPELVYGRGILAMANSGPSTNGSQFFMVYGGGELDPDYTAFGSISPEGLQVIDEIARAGHDGSFDAGAGGGAPIQPVVIETATVG